MPSSANTADQGSAALTNTIIDSNLGSPVKPLFANTTEEVLAVGAGVALVSFLAWSIFSKGNKAKPAGATGRDLRRPWIKKHYRHRRGH